MLGILPRPSIHQLHLSNLASSGPIIARISHSLFCSIIITPFNSFKNADTFILLIWTDWSASLLVGTRIRTADSYEPGSPDQLIQSSHQCPYSQPETSRIILP